jgi:hypothetical protein
MGAVIGELFHLLGRFEIDLVDLFRRDRVFSVFDIFVWDAASVHAAVVKIR